MMRRCHRSPPPSRPRPGRACLFVLVILVTLVAARPAASGIIRMPEDYPNVLEGLDAAVAGDSVIVGPGRGGTGRPGR
jgi:hypothetical protein